MGNLNFTKEFDALLKSEPDEKKILVELFNMGFTLRDFRKDSKIALDWALDIMEKYGVKAPAPRKRRIFSDYDGTFVKWKRSAGPDEYSKEGYSMQLEENKNYAEALRILSKSDEVELWGNSAVLPMEHCKKEKTARFREAGIRNFAFTECGKKKIAGLMEQGVIRDGDVIIDDWNPNLEETKHSGLDLIAIKMCTEESDSTRAWDGYRISEASSPQAIADTILGIVAAWDARHTA